MEAFPPTDRRINIATALKTEISRVARKEIRSDTLQLKKVTSHYRTEIASLKRRISDLERIVKSIAKPSRKPAIEIVPAQAPLRFRFSAASLAAHRVRLGLSADEMGFLIGVSGQSVYKWERERASPRASQLPALRAAVKLGKRDALRRLANK